MAARWRHKQQEKPKSGGNKQTCVLALRAKQSMTLCPLFDPQLAMRGPPGPAGMTGRNGPVVSSFSNFQHSNIVQHEPKLCFSPERTLWLMRLPFL